MRLGTDKKTKDARMLNLLLCISKWALITVGCFFVLSTIYMVNLLDEIMEENQRSGALIDGQPKLVQFHQKNDWSLPFIHVINTRFMQHQGNLVELARARLVLFKTFCLPTVLNQTLLYNESIYPDADVPSFLWIIKTDPQLNETVRDEMVQLLEPYPFVYLVGSNVNFGIGVLPGGWRGGEAGEDVLNSTIFTGEIAWLRLAHEARERKLVLETRLDADDGLHIRYLQSIQSEALKKLKWGHHGSESRMKWRYWCIINHLEWNPTPPSILNSKKHRNSSEEAAYKEIGIFVPLRGPHQCITPGLTVAISVGETQPPSFPHDELYHELRAKKPKPGFCGNSDDKCLRMVQEPFLAAIRSRTATSAGMKNIPTRPQDSTALSKIAMHVDHKQLRAILRLCFSIDISTVVETNSFVQSHLADIVQENLEGQCTHGHSCKNSTKEALHNLLKIEGKEQNPDN